MESRLNDFPISLSLSFSSHTHIHFSTLNISLSPYTITYTLKLSVSLSLSLSHTHTHSRTVNFYCVCYLLIIEFLNILWSHVFTEYHVEYFLFLLIQVSSAIHRGYVPEKFVREYQNRYFRLKFINCPPHLAVSPHFLARIVETANTNLANDEGLLYPQVDWKKIVESKIRKFWIARLFLRLKTKQKFPRVSNSLPTVTTNGIFQPIFNSSFF